MTHSPTVDHRELFGDPTVDVEAPPIALMAAAAIQLNRGGAARTNPIFQSLTAMGQFHPRRNSMQPQKPAWLVCAIGRWVTNNGDRGGLNWAQPCHYPVFQIHIFGQERKKIALCRNHHDALMSKMTAIGVAPVKRPQPVEEGEPIRCDAGRRLLRTDGDPEWTVRCEADPTMHVNLAGYHQPMFFCGKHGQILEDHGLIAGDALVIASATLN